MPELREPSRAISHIEQALYPSVWQFPQELYREATRPRPRGHLADEHSAHRPGSHLAKEQDSGWFWRRTAHDGGDGS